MMENVAKDLIFEQPNKEGAQLVTCNGCAGERQVVDKVYTDEAGAQFVTKADCSDCEGSGKQWKYCQEEPKIFEKDSQTGIRFFKVASVVSGFSMLLMLCDCVLGIYSEETGRHQLEMIALGIVLACVATVILLWVAFVIGKVMYQNKADTKTVEYLDAAKAVDRSSVETFALGELTQQTA